MKRISCCLIMVVGCFFLIHNAYSANIADTYGLSPKGMGMGNAMTAHVNDWSSVFYNVAGLGRTKHIPEGQSRSELYLGYLRTMPMTELDIPQRYDGTDIYETNADEDLGFGSFVIGTALDLKSVINIPSMISSSRFGLALSIGDDRTIARINDTEPQTHNYLRFGKEAQQMLLISGVGMGFYDDSFGFGLGLKATFGGQGNMYIKDVSVDPDSQTPNVQAKMDLKINKPSWIIGFYIDGFVISERLDGLDIGFSYQQESKFELEFDTISIVQLGYIPLNLDLSMFDYYQPASFRIGCSYVISDRWFFAMDIEYQTWSDYEVSSNQSYNYGSILPDLNNIFIPKFGLEYKANPNTKYYFGYYYQPSFIPNEAVDGEVNWLDNDKHVFSFGTSYDIGKWAALKKSVLLHAGYQLQYLVDRKVTKKAPDTTNPSYSYGGMVHTLMLGLSF